jgi:hypothetical protein
MKDRSQPSGQQSTYRGGMVWLLVGFVTGVVSLFCVSAAEAQYRLCIPSTTWFGTPTPTLDGTITSSTEWRGAFQAELGPPAAPDVVLRGMRDANNLYLFVQANNLDHLSASNPNPYTANLLVLTFQDVGSGNYEQIQILPVVANPTVPSTNISSGTITYWTGTGSPISWSIFNPPGPIHHPTWIGSSNVRASYSTDGVGTFPFHWALEMALPIKPPAIAGLTMPNSGFFQLYVDVFRVVSGKFQQASWPPNQTETGCPSGSDPLGCNPNEQTPPPSTWGASTIDANQACSLVNIDRISVSNVTNADGILIDVLSPNTFKAQVTNSVPPASTGLPDTAKQVSATFSIWNYGIPSLPQWQTVPTSNNPTPAADLPAGPTTLSPNAWTVPAADRDKYDPNFLGFPPPHPHQCIRVQLTSNDRNTSFTNNPAFQNMDFVHASSFEGAAEVSAKGYPERPDNSGTAGKNYDQLFDLNVMTREEVLKPGQVGTVGRAIVPPASNLGKGRESIASQLTMIVAGCRHTGYYMTINNQTLELCDPVGAFGYVVRHEGARAVKNWSTELIGEGLKQTQKNVYQLRIAKDGVATVTTRVEPKEGGVCSRLPGARASFVLLFGVFVVGLMAYRPWRKKKE